MSDGEVIGLEVLSDELTADNLMKWIFPLP